MAHHTVGRRERRLESGRRPPILTIGGESLLVLALGEGVQEGAEDGEARADGAEQGDRRAEDEDRV